MKKESENFDESEFNFSKATRRRERKPVDHDPKVMVSLRMDPHLVSLLRDEADRSGIPYQTLMSSIMLRYVTGELVDKQEARKIAV